MRATASRAAARLTSRVLRLPLQDPLSGFFAVRREVFERCSAKLATKGFKVLLDLIVLSEARRLAEVPFLFAPRRFGRSKLGAGVVWAWMAQLSGLKPKRSRHALRVQTVTSVVTPMEGPA